MRIVPDRGILLVICALLAFWCVFSAYQVVYYLSLWCLTFLGFYVSFLGSLRFVWCLTLLADCGRGI